MRIHLNVSGTIIHRIELPDTNPADDQAVLTKLEAIAVTLAELQAKMTTVENSLSALEARETAEDTDAANTKAALEAQVADLQAKLDAATANAADPAVVDALSAKLDDFQSRLDAIDTPPPTVTPETPPA